MFKEWQYFVRNRNSANACCRLALFNIKPFALYGEIYRLHGKYIEPVADDCFWSALTADADTLYKKYKDTPQGEFAKSLILGVCREIEASYKRNINN